MTGFVRLYERQIKNGGAMNWTKENELTLSSIEEMKNLSALMYGIVASSSDRLSGVGAGRRRGDSHEVITTVFVERSLHLLQQVVYAVLHPHHLSSLLEPTNMEGKHWLESAQSNGSASSDAVGDQPVVASVIYELLTVARNLIDGLVVYSTAVQTLTKDVEEWKIDRAVVLPVRFIFICLFAFSSLTYWTFPRRQPSPRLRKHPLERYLISHPSASILFVNLRPLFLSLLLLPPFSPAILLSHLTRLAKRHSSLNISWSPPFC